MEARLQRRVQRYGWDLAAGHYEAAWQRALAPAQAALLERAALQPAERVLDIACGTGEVTLAAADRIGPRGHALGTDLSERMVAAAIARARAAGCGHAAYARMDGEALDIPDASVDVALCALGLMYMPEPERALREMHRVLRPGGRVALAVWGERSRCGWAALFPIVDAEVASDVCPLFFGLGAGDALATACEAAGFEAIESLRIDAALDYADGDEACIAAFVAGPVALAWSRFDAATRERVRGAYLAAIEPWRVGEAYRVGGEFVVVSARRPG